VDDSLRRRLDAIVALLGIVAAAVVAALFLSFRLGGLVVTAFVLFVGTVAALFVDAELY